MSGFVDLRLNRERHSSSGDFWPSFTDIMMVIVMIFLLTSTVVIIKNWELVRELRLTMEAEMQATELVKMASETNMTLEDQLLTLQQEVRSLQGEAVLREAALKQRDEIERQQQTILTEQQALLLQRERELQQRDLTLQEQQQQLNQAKMQVVARDREINQRDELLQAERETVKKKSSEVAERDQQLSQSREELAALQAELAKRIKTLEDLMLEYRLQGESLQTVKQNYSELERESLKKEQELARLARLSELAKMDVNALQREFEQLRGKYDALIRPARSSQGKFVVEARYTKKGGKRGDEAVYQLRQEGEAAYRDLNLAQLHKELAAYKQKHPKDLYVRIIIPNESGLGYDEAWAFTNDILTKYDYYHDAVPAPASGSEAAGKAAPTQP
ncbi:MAG: hypothetical protein HQL49_11515 [Gammaproteobacteria bacterium]|nr:hypothetical protein [Gammaproteobacteria bacterium]